MDTEKQIEKKQDIPLLINQCKHQFLDVEYLDGFPTGYLVCYECQGKIPKEEIFKKFNIFQ